MLWPAAGASSGGTFVTSTLPAVLKQAGLKLRGIACQIAACAPSSRSTTTIADAHAAAAVRRLLSLFLSVPGKRAMRECRHYIVSASQCALFCKRTLP